MADLITFSSHALAARSSDCWLPENLDTGLLISITLKLRRQLQFTESHVLCVQ
jgi:hypothetical protein